MRRSRRTTKRVSLPKDTSSSDDEPLQKKKNSAKAQKESINEDSSSESDIENYLKPANKIDLSSLFFTNSIPATFDSIEKDIFSGIQQLTDSNSESDDAEENLHVFSKEEKQGFEHLHEYNKKLEDAKKYVEKYKAKKVLEESNLDVGSMLAKGEAKSLLAPENELQSSDFESFSESEKEDWEEVQTKEEKTVIPKDGVEITVKMPDVVRKKKGIDLVAAMKRRINRIKKENQVYVHQVHLLCWIAHGNFVNKTLNSDTLLGLALSLLPSQHCYPQSRLDLTYLQQILTWYRKTITCKDKSVPKSETLEDFLQAQISKKEAYDYKMFVYIFICILRSLGIQTRLVLSLQVEPLRPPASELCSLSNEQKPRSSNKNDVSTTPKVNHRKSENKLKSSIKKNLNVSKNGRKNDHQNIKRNKSEKTVSPKLDQVVGDKKNNPTPRSLKNTKGETSKRLEESQKKNGDTKTKDAKKLKQNLIEMTIEENEINNDKGVKLRSGKPGNTNSKSSREEEVHESELENLKPPRRRSLRLSSRSPTELSRTDSKQKKLKAPADDTISIKEEPREPELETIKIPRRRSVRLSSKSPTDFHQNNDENDVVFIESDVEVKRRKKPNLFKVKMNFRKMRNAGVKSVDANEIRVSQIDGTNDTDSDCSMPKSKPKLNKLKTKTETTCPSKKHPNRLQSEPNKKLSLKKLRTPLDIKLSNLRNISRSQSSTTSSDSGKSRFFSDNPSKKQIDVRNDIVNLIKKDMSNSKAKRARHVNFQGDSSDDSDFKPEPVRKKKQIEDGFKKKTSTVKVKRRIPSRKDLLEAEKIKKEEKMEEKKRKDVNVWIEVFAEAEEKWISVDVVKGKLHCVNELYTRSTHPVSYILAWDNDSFIKDITKRYCINWNTVTRKLRVSPTWWDSTLKSYASPRTARDREEEDDLARQQLEQPLPTTISEYKDHPLYVLKRHLLKFQAIYPPDSVTLGFIRNEPVYSRDCVYVLHSREIWLKEAKVVKLGEQPYKIVKARPKYDKLSNTMITDKPLEIFGVWQVEDYIPPSAENGIVPRNAYGNVELFKPSMLPKGTVHLQLPGLNKVARKLNVDCATAVVGFDFHGGWNHAIYDGFIVCEEEADRLVAAWYLEQEEAEKRAQEKLEKRVYDNWRKLIKGLWIRERLKARYDFALSAPETKDNKSKKKCKRFE